MTTLYVALGDNGEWLVKGTHSDEIVAGPFKTNAEAWNYVDRNFDQARADDEKHDRIGKAIGQW